MSPDREIEALLFLSPTPLDVERMAEVTGRPADEVRGAVDALSERLEQSGSGLEVAHIAGGVTLRTRPELAEVCDRLRQRPPADTLSPAALETLAVVAYLQPVGRPEISRLRGVSADATVAMLMERGLVEEAGRVQGGQAMLYRTTQAFQERFGLRDAKDLPELAGFELSGDEAHAIRRRLVESGHLSEDDAPGDGAPGPAPVAEALTLDMEADAAGVPPADDAEAPADAPDDDGEETPRG